MDDFRCPAFKSPLISSFSRALSAAHRSRNAVSCWQDCAPHGRRRVPLAERRRYSKDDLFRALSVLHAVRIEFSLNALEKGPDTLCRSRPKFAPIQPLQEEKGKGQTVSGRSSISLQFAKFLSGSCCKMGQSRCRERRENKRPARAGAKYRANCRTGQKNNTHEAYAPPSPRRRRRFDTKSICPAAPRSSGIFVAIWLSRRCYVLSQTQNFVGGKQQKAPAKAWASPKRKTRWPKFGKQLQRKKDSGGLSAVAGVLVVLPTTAKA